MHIKVEWVDCKKPLGVVKTHWGYKSTPKLIISCKYHLCVTLEVIVLLKTFSSDRSGKLQVEVIIEGVHRKQVVQGVCSDMIAYGFLSILPKLNAKCATQWLFSIPFDVSAEKLCLDRFSPIGNTLWSCSTNSIWLHRTLIFYILVNKRIEQQNYSFPVWNLCRRKVILVISTKYLLFSAHTC